MTKLKFSQDEIAIILKAVIVDMMKTKNAEYKKNCKALLENISGQLKNVEKKGELK